MSNEPELPGLPAVPDSGPAGSLLNFVALAVRDPTIDVAKLDALLRMEREIRADAAATEYKRAMNAAQAEIQPVARTAENTQTKSFYAKLEDVDAAIRPIYLHHGFSLSYNTVPPLVPGNVRVECRCSHVAGHSDLFYREAPADTLGPKGAPVKTILHGGGSTETFLKRYLACGIFNVVFKNQDDDGVRGGMKFISAEQVKDLSDLMMEVGTNLDAFCQLWGIEILPNMLEANFAPAMNMLTARKRVKEGAKA